MRLSRGRRYSTSEGFTPPTQFENDQDTLALYAIEEGAGELLLDSSGNGNDGKIIGAKWVKLDSQAAVVDSTSIGDTPPPAIAPFDEAQAKAHQQTWADYLGEPVVTTNSIGTKLAVIPPGEFVMGESGWSVDVTLTKPFRMGVHEVTQGEWKAVMGGDEPWRHQKVGKGDNFPAIIVDWTNATAFCRRLTERERAAGKLRDGWEYRLPTEAEWEYACRAGTTTTYSFGDKSLLGEYAWYEWNTKNAGEAYAHAVGLKKPNPWGLYDVHGNVIEWCSDWYGDALPGGTDPKGAVEGSDRVLKGGGIINTAEICESAARGSENPSGRGESLGFRLALAPVAGTPMKDIGPSVLKTSGNAPPPAIAPFSAAQAKGHQQAWAAYLGVPVEYTNSIGMKFRLIPPGEFLMGSTPEEIEAAIEKIVLPGEIRWEQCFKSEGPRHKVILTHPIYVGATEVTQAQYEQVIRTNPSHFSATGEGKDLVIGLDTSNYPVETVSWNDAVEFCAKLSQQEKLKPFYVRSGETVMPLDGTGYRLPTEAEWEFACRGGTTTRFWSGDGDQDLSQTAWSGKNSRGRSHEVGTLKANPFDLSDMHGNVWEWVQDSWQPEFYGKFEESAAVDPSSPFPASSQRVIRGGNWFYPESRCRSSLRFADFRPLPSNNGIGFRVVLPVEAVKEGSQQKDASSTGKVTKGWPADAPSAAIAPFDAAQARAHQQAWAKHLGTQVETVNSVGQTMILIPPGEFLMGSTDEQVEAALKVADQLTKDRIQKNERPQHKVVITKPLLMSATEVTIGQFQQFAAATGYETEAEKAAKDATKTATYLAAASDDLPAAFITWNDATAYCQWLSTQEKAVYRLPTEAEWEYACRAGTTTQYSFGDDVALLDQYGWYQKNAGGKSHPVGTKLPNGFGLFDMHGNLQEWCSDYFDEKWYSTSPPNDPNGPSAGSHRVIRGGYWLNNASNCRSAYRHFLTPSTRNYTNGFRCVRVIDAALTASVKPVTPPAVAAPPVPSPAIAPFDAAAAKALQDAWAKQLGEPVVTTNSIDMQLAVIPPGSFKMGESGETVDVTLTKPFRLGIHVVTQGQWQAVMVTEPWKGQVNVIEGDKIPATYVSWTDATDFCHQLTERERAAGKLRDGWEYRLPTEAEWEWACRAGTTTRYSFGDDESLLEEHAWFNSNTKNAGEAYAHQVGLKKPNPWGLYDIHGNVWEWCSDWSGDALPGGTDPSGPTEGSHRVHRGGSCDNSVRGCRSALRLGGAPSGRHDRLGFRVALSPVVQAAPPPAVAPFDEVKANAHQQAWAKHLGEPVVTTNSIGMKLAVIPPGTFSMGEGREAVTVALTKPFRCGVHEVTQGQWKAVMASEPWSKGADVQKGENFPAMAVKWTEATEFCHKLTEHERVAGKITDDWEYRLPTDAEWEFACRAGTMTKYSFGGDGALMDQYAWYDSNTISANELYAHSVGLKLPNPWGLHDMHGNVSEWCLDWYKENIEDGGVDPQGPSEGTLRVLRGGSWKYPAGDSRSANRWRYDPSSRNFLNSFRVVLSPIGKE